MEVSGYQDDMLKGSKDAMAAQAGNINEKKEVAVKTAGGLSETA